MDMKFFKVTYKERGKTREKFLMLEKKPEPQKPFSSLLTVEVSNPFTEGFGGVYGSKECPYGGCLPKKSKIGEICVEEFLDAIRKTVEKNYVEKKSVKDLVESNILYDHIHKY